MHRLIVNIVAVSGLMGVACNQDGETTPAEPDASTDTSQSDPVGEHPESEDDRAIAATVRRDVASADGLSASARRVTIVCRSGTVTLRGPVLHVHERARIASLASRVAGVHTVRDLLDVASN